MMILLEAIDLYGGQAVRLYKGDYDQMTVYDKEPIRVAVKMEMEGSPPTSIGWIWRVRKPARRPICR